VFNQLNHIDLPAWQALTGAVLAVTYSVWLAVDRWARR